jgi:hypothetical protein
MDEGTMSTSNAERAEVVSRARATTIERGRLTMYAALGALTWVVPVPLLPDVLAKRVRGALAFDVAARHGLSLTREARDVLAEPGGVEGPRGAVAGAAQYFGLRLLRRIGPMGFAGRFVGPARSGVSTWALGYLFDRYLERARKDAAVRIDVDEARRVRLAIDRATVHALTAQGKAEEPLAAPEEVRDTVTQVVDGVLAAVASVPGWLVRRLDAAFDELMPTARA